jgi:hypothetical protein
MSALAPGALLMSMNATKTRKEPAMYTMAEIELSKQHREDVAQQVENNRLAVNFGRPAPGCLPEQGTLC